ncbi:MAG: O-antigen ligase family protein, partial [Nitrospinota bacterium]
MNPEYLRYSTRFGFYIIALFLPMSISVTQIGLGIVLGSWLLKIVGEGRLSFVKTPLNKPVAIYLCGLLISAVLGYNAVNSLLSIREAWTCLLFFSMLALIQDLKTVKRLIILVLTGSFVAAIYGIVQHPVGGLDLFRPAGQEVIQYAHLQVPHEVLAIGFFKHHLTFGEMILITLCFCTAYVLVTFSASSALKQKGHLANLLLLPLIVVLGVALLYSYSRSSWVGFVIAFFFMLLFFKKKTSTILLAFFLPAVVLTASFHPPTKGRIMAIFSQKERLYIGKIAFQFAAEKPLTGIGLN